MRSCLHIIGGVTGAVAGFLATLLALELSGFGNWADPLRQGYWRCWCWRRPAR